MSALIGLKQVSYALPILEGVLLAASAGKASAPDGPRPGAPLTVTE